MVDATVTLRDDRGRSETYRELGGGIYQLEGNLLQAVTGLQYTLEIVLEDGTTYRTASQSMPPAVGADSTYINLRQEQIINDQGNVLEETAIDLLVDTPVLTGEAQVWLRWTFDQTYSFVSLPCNPFNQTPVCYFTHPPEDPIISLATNADLSADRLTGIQVGRIRNINRLNEEYTEGRHCFSVYQHSITEEAFTYWSDLDEVVNQSGSIFDAVPAEVRGNVFNVDDPEESVLGFFELAQIDTVRHCIIPQDILGAFFIAPYCPPGINSYSDFLLFNGTINFGCCSCLEFAGASVERPEWF